MTKDYITEYSYGLAESFNLIAPRLLVSNNESLGKDSKMYEFMLGQGVPEGQAADYVKGMPTYWETNLLLQHTYIGIVLSFGIIALFIDERKIKYVFLSGAITLVLSWEKFPCINRFLYRLCSNV
jgi:hypothetical protein